MKQNRRKRSIELMVESEAEQEQGIDRLRIVLVIIIFILIAFFVAMIVLPPRVELSALQDKQATAQKQLEKAQAEKQQAKNHLEWLEDPEYAEQIARDRADQALEGETVIKRAEDSAEDSPENKSPEGREGNASSTGNAGSIKKTRSK